MHLSAPLAVLELRQHLDRDEPTKRLIERDEPRGIGIGEREERPRFEARDLDRIRRSHRLPIFVEHRKDDGEA